MSQIYEFNREEKKKFPELRYGDRIFKVNNTRKTMKAFELMITSEKTKEDDKDELTLKMFLGEEAAKIIIDDELPFPALTELIEIIMAAATDMDVEELKAQQENAKKK